MPLTINGQRVDDAVVDSEFSTIKAYHENLGNVSCCERDPEFRATATQNVVARILLSQEAARRIDPTPDPEVDAAIEKLKEEYGGEGWFFARTGATAETMHLVRHDVDLDFRVRRLLEGLAAEGPAPDEADLRRFYDEHLEAFMTPEEVRASHILKNPRGEARQAAYDELRQARRELLGGADFDTLARKHSEKADEHIDLDFFKSGELAPEFEAVAFSMEVGEISPVFASSYGLHLIKLTDRKPAAPRPFDEARPDVERMYRETRRNQRTRELVDRLRAAATIEEAAEAAPETEPAVV